jgi:hypothetical protein
MPAYHICEALNEILKHPIPCQPTDRSDGILGLGARAAAMSALRVA